ALIVPPYKTVAQSFHLGGLGNFDIKVRRSPGTTQFANQYKVQVHQGTMQWEEFPYPLQELSGTLDIQPGHWEIRNFQGRHHGGVFRAYGRSYPAAPGQASEVPHIALE